MNIFHVVLIIVAVILLGVCIWQGLLFAKDIKKAREKKKLGKDNNFEKKGDNQ